MQTYFKLLKKGFNSMKIFYYIFSSLFVSYSSLFSIKKFEFLFYLVGLFDCTFKTAAAHFEHLLTSYGSPLIVLDLLKVCLRCQEISLLALGVVAMISSLFAE